MQKARLLCLNVEDGKGFYEVECKKLEDYYKHLGCDCFDITSRKIGNKAFDIFCDDIGLFKDKPIVSAVDKALRPALVGNLIFANHDNMGNTTSLSDEDIELIMDEKITAFDFDTSRSWDMITLS